MQKTLEENEEGSWQSSSFEGCSEFGGSFEPATGRLQRTGIRHDNHWNTHPEYSSTSRSNLAIFSDSWDEPKLVGSPLASPSAA